MLVDMTNELKSKDIPMIAGNSMGDNLSRVAGPASTGGAGTFFEQHVDAYWLALLLVQGIPPIMHNCVLVEVHFQTEHLGWHTDDFLLVGQDGSGNNRKLVGQVKRTFSVSASSDECKKAVQDFWRDFKNPRQFSPTNDRFALVTLRGTNTLLEYFSGLLDCARSARDGADFERLLTIPGFCSAKVANYCDVIRSIVGEIEGKSVSRGEVWSFLRVIHILSLDLNSSTRQTEAAIKSLLAYTAGGQDPLGAAEASWSALLREVGEGMPQASTYRRRDLSEALRQRHSPVGGNEQLVLRKLSDHSELILEGIRSTIGYDLHLSRSRPVQEVIEQLELTQVVIVSGPAGSGKSGIAKDTIGFLAADHFAFSFRAEEFASPHFDGVLQKNQISSNARTLGAILAGQGRKVMLVESVERLLEASTHDAFTDLLTLVAKDSSWRLILTCRDYSTDLVRSAFLETARVGHSVVIVPQLDDEELREVEHAYPALAYPLADNSLRKLLRNPYFMDRALQIDWSDGRPLPQSEREFRLRFWQEIIRAEHHTANGMPRRRGEAFIQVALRRARALTLYAPCNDLDANVVDALLRDSLIASSPQSEMLLAPAHDILEDWAIIQWIEERYATYEGSIQALSSILGTWPAVRRTYRKWVTELVERDSESADRVLQAVIHDDELSAQFRDDTLVSLLRSSISATFLQRYKAELFANGKQLLRRVIHLLRVACVTTPTWLETSSIQPSLFNVPDGQAWACVLRLVVDNLGSFTDYDRTLLLGFIEDWARGVSWQTPYPEGAESVAAIAHWLLPNFDNYQSEDQLKRTLKVIAKIPNADRERFTALLQGNDEECDRVLEEFQEIIFTGLEGMPMARDMPEVVVSAANNYLLCSEDDLKDRWGYTSDLDLETLFGIKYGRGYDFFPESAYRGPFLPLLRYDLRQGLDFIISLFNHSADWYAHPRVRNKYVESPFEIKLIFADGTSKTQWCNARLWNLYRGISVGPSVLQSLLMALERWLLEFAQAYPSELDTVMLYILKQSDSAALTSVVASVATAFPHSSGETLLVLLSCPECIRLDRCRMSGESQAPSKLPLPRISDRNMVYEEERKDADVLPHRQHDIEMAIINLQLGSLTSRVHQLFDQHHAMMRPVADQDEEGRIWRLVLHRMDLRQYSVADADLAEDDSKSEEHELTSYREQHILLDLKEPEADVKEMVDKNATGFQFLEDRVGLLMWGIKIFAHEEEQRYDPTQWRQRLQESRVISSVNVDADEYELAKGGPGFVAVVCLRDHWDEMSGDEQEWSINTICSEVERTADNWNHIMRVQRGGMEGDRPCAWSIPLLLGRPLEKALRSRVLHTLVVALTHPINEVRMYAASGVGSHLWGIDRELVIRCVYALATEAAMVQQTADAEFSRPYEERRQIDQLEAEIALSIRHRFFESDAFSEDAYQAMDTTRGFGAEANVRILSILGQAPSEPMTIAAFKRLATTLLEWWDSDDDRRQDRHHKRSVRNHETEFALADLLEHFLFRTTAENATTIIKPIIDAVDHHPDNVRWFLLGLLGIEDRQPNTSQFWSLWKLFADKVRHAKWLEGIDNEYSHGTEMISAIFLGARWKDGVRHWRSMEGYAERVHALFEDLPASSTVLDAYLRLLYHVGEQSLPESFIRIAKRLQQGEARQMMMRSNTVFLLEVLLQRYVYGKPLEVKRQADLREAVLVLLDLLVECGSSAAFQMRDDFVTPLSINL